MVYIALQTYLIKKQYIHWSDTDLLYIGLIDGFTPCWMS
jgi:hypothetical protein